MKDGVMKEIVSLCISVLLAGCNARNNGVMRIEAQGSFAVGGTVLADSLGHSFSRKAFALLLRGYVILC